MSATELIELMYFCTYDIDFNFRYLFSSFIQITVTTELLNLSITVFPDQPFQVNLQNEGIV